MNYKGHKDRLKVNKLRMKIEAKTPRITKRQVEKVEGGVKKLFKKVESWRLKRLNKILNLDKM